MVLDGLDWPQNQAKLMKLQLKKAALGGLGTGFGGAGGDRTRVRQQSAYRSTCLAVSTDLSPSGPTGRVLVPIP